MSDEGEKKESSIYFDLEEAWDEAVTDFSAGTNKDIAASTAKLLGKTIFNTGVFAGKLGVSLIKELPHELEKKQVEREEMRKKYEGKSDEELQKIINSDGFFCASHEEKVMAQSILRRRNEG